MAVPKTMKAVVVVKVSTPTDDDDRDVALQEVPVPELLPGMYRVKSEAIALNPTDWKSCYTKTILNGRTGAICGCDFAGTIVEIGPDVSGKFKIGDRVAGWQHGTCALNPQFGAFAEYVAGDEHGMWKIPDDVSFERAASSGVAVSTAGLGLFCHLGVPYPGGGGEKAQGDVLFYGGSTTVSQIGIQFAKRAGLRVIVTASPKNHEKLKSLGADVTIDYKDPDECIKQIREATGGKLKIAYDGISEGESLRIVHESMTRDEPAKIAHVLRVDDKLEAVKRPNIEDIIYFSYFAIGRDCEFYGQHIPAMPYLKSWMRKAMALAQTMAAEGKLQLQEIEILPNGLAGVTDGYHLARGDTKGLGPKKMVLRVSETPA